MLRHVWIRIKRRPLICAAIGLFAAIIALALCGLHSGNNIAVEKYNDIYSEIDVRCSVTNLTGNKSDRLTIYPGTIALFTEQSDLSDLLEDVQIKGSVEIQWNNEVYTLTGITSTEIEPKLWPDNGCTIFWNEGSDSRFFSGNRLECIIPRELQKKMEDSNLPADHFPLHITAVLPYESDYNAALEVLGAYEGTNDRIIYCPWNTLVSILNTIGRSETADSLFATLSNNDNLPLLREIASQYFAEPDVRYAGLGTIDNYYLALDINDSQLTQARTNLENSMTVNRIATILVLAFSAVAGAFIGFLMIRNRKKEISLMRTMGASYGRIYLSFVMEQMLFVVLGALVGGLYFMWNPVLWLVLFVCAYFVGLSVMLFIMLRRNLLVIIKEDE